MDIKDIIAPLRKWWWMIISAALVAAVASFVATLRQVPNYQSHTTLMIGQTITDPNPSLTEFSLGQQLAASYADMAMREPVRNSTMQALGLSFLPGYTVQALPNSQVIEIAVTDTDPGRAQSVAQELAHQLVLRTPTSDNPETEQRLAFIQSQLDQLQTQIDETTSDIDNLQSQLGSLNSAQEIGDTQARISALKGKRTEMQNTYTNLLANTQRGAINSVTVIDEADLPTHPTDSNRLMAILLAGAVGCVLALGAAYLIEFLDDTVKTTEEVERLLDYPIIGYVGTFPKETNRSELVTDPHSPYAPMFRYLRTNLAFADAASPVRSLLVTSAEPNSGKTTVAVNLAFVIAQAEKKVVLVDADFHRPNIHSLLGLNNRTGLSDVFRERSSLQDIIRVPKEGKLTVITTGTLPPNPTELLASQRMDEFLENARGVADTVVINSSPFIVADAAILASKVDGVLWVIRLGYTRRTHIRAMKDEILRSGSRVVGLVVNGVPERSTYYTSYYHSVYYGVQEESKKEAVGKRTAVQPISPNTQPIPTSEQPVNPKT